MTSRTFLSDSGTASYYIKTISVRSPATWRRTQPHHLISTPTVHETIQIAEDFHPQFCHTLHALPLRQLHEIVQEDLTEQSRCAQTSFAHALWIAAENLRLEQLVEHRKDEPLEYHRQVDFGIRKDLVCDEGPL